MPESTTQIHNNGQSQGIAPTNRRPTVEADPRVCSEKDDDQKAGRHSIRLKGFDYSSAGAYFITICTLSRRCLFGEIIDNRITLNHAGQMAHRIWYQIPDYYPGIDIDAFIVMPNHIHGIIVINKIGQSQGIAPTTIVVGVERWRYLMSMRL